MIHVFVDSEVLLDFLTERDDFYRPARKLLTFSYQGYYDLWMCVTQANKLFYRLTGGGLKSRCAQGKAALAALLEKVHIASLTEEEARRALASDIDDFEDALILSCAMSVGADVIVTRDVGLKNGLIPTRTPEEFFGWLREKHGIDLAEMQLVDGRCARTL